MPPGEDIQFVYTWGESMIIDYVGQHNCQRWLCKVHNRSVQEAFKLPLITLALNIQNTNSNDDIISIFLCPPWTSEVNLVNQATGKNYSQEFLQFPKIQDFLEHVHLYRNGKFRY